MDEPGWAWVLGELLTLLVVVVMVAGLAWEFWVRL